VHHPAAVVTLSYDMDIEQDRGGPVGLALLIEDGLHLDYWANRCRWRCQGENGRFEHVQFHLYMTSRWYPCWTNVYGDWEEDGNTKRQFWLLRMQLITNLRDALSSLDIIDVTHLGWLHGIYRWMGDLSRKDGQWAWCLLPCKHIQMIDSLHWGQRGHLAPWLDSIDEKEPCCYLCCPCPCHILDTLWTWSQSQEAVLGSHQQSWQIMGGNGGGHHPH